MKILFVSATEFEIAPLLKNFKMILSGKMLTTFHFKKHTIDILVTGAGMTATAFYLGKTLNKKYDFAINFGTAGSFKKNIPPGTVVNVVNDCFADLGAEDGEKLITLSEMGLAKKVLYFNKYKNSSIKRIIEGLPKVNGITVNTTHGNETSIQKVVKKFNSDIESMEGAAFFYACNKEKIPCIQIRSISNYVERRNKKKWKMKLAIKNLNLFAFYLSCRIACNNCI
ncbi:MAG: futalosine hydrolase [Bacteroidota bacterium]